jgi:hypothetical protein
MQPCGKHFLRAKRQGIKKKVFLIHKILDFHSFSKKESCTWFYIMKPSTWLLRFDIQVLNFFQNNLQIPQYWRF